MEETAAAFLLGFSALFSIVNPLSGAFIFREVTTNRSRPDRDKLARQVGINSLIVMLGALWLGSYILAFFGISLSSVRVAGGLFVAHSGWELLNAPERREARKQEQAAPSENDTDVALFPLTIPFTTGPGTISVAVALGAGRVQLSRGGATYIVGMSLAALAVAIIIWVSYRYTDRLAARLGPAGSKIVTRLAAFLLLCIGVQIMIGGVEDILTPLLAMRGGKA
jgi:multiple antibiotic resistance protein